MATRLGAGEAPTPKRPRHCNSELDSDCIDLTEMARSRGGAGSASGGRSGTESKVAKVTCVFKGRPGGTKAAKEDHARAKQRELGLYAQAAATDKMVEAQMLRGVGLQDQNLLLFLTTNDAALVNVEAREYMQLWRVHKLRKLKLRLVKEDEAERIREEERGRKQGSCGGSAAGGGDEVHAG